MGHWTSLRFDSSLAISNLAVALMRELFVRRYSIEDSSCPVEINPVDGTLSLKTKLDRELTAVHRCPVTAEENILDGKEDSRECVIFRIKVIKVISILLWVQWVNSSMLQLASLGKKSYVMVNLVVQDINDNAPKLFNGEIFVCESDKRGTVSITTLQRRDVHSIFTTCLSLCLCMSVCTHPC